MQPWPRTAESGILGSMFTVALLLFFTGGDGAHLLDQSGFSDADERVWQVWSQRPSLAPRAWIEGVISCGEPGSLGLSGNGNAAVYGGWERRLDGIEAGAWYQLRAHYRSSGVRDESQRVLARLDWQTGSGERAGQPEYGTVSQDGAEWRTIVLSAPAPVRAAAVKVQLLLANAPQGTVWWDEVRFERIPAPVPRKVRVASVNFSPRRTGSMAESVRRFIEEADKRIDRADLIVFPEAMTLRGTGKKYLDVAEPLTGPGVRALSAFARSRHAYVVAGVMELEGTTAYNTAVLLDREGALIGRYRKVYLPREEVEGGLTPGDDYPVFQTDFGTVGLMICWDIQYPDPARALALRGAEIVAVPIAGGNVALGHARAIENHVFMVSSGYDYPTEIVDPSGKVVASTSENPGVAITEIDLSRRYTDPWLGHMRDRFFHEIRFDVPVKR